MKLLQVTEQNKSYYSADYVKGFNDGAKAQFEADKKDAERTGRWIKHPWGGGVHTCSVCGERANIILANGYLTGDASPSGETGGYYHYDRVELLSNFCPNCGIRMEANK